MECALAIFAQVLGDLRKSERLVLSLWKENQQLLQRIQELAQSHQEQQQALLAEMSADAKTKVEALQM